MKIFGIIAEYNPFHNGHLKLLRFVRSLCDDAIIVCVMSGNFTQRAQPAILDKYTRAKHAVLCGADAVVELPAFYATASAHDFAEGGIKLLKKINATDICFGSECGDIKKLQNLAEKSIAADGNKKLKTLLKKGESYAKALSDSVDDVDRILDKPNNLLAVEYLKAIKLFDADIIPHTLKREDDYNSEDTDQPTSSSAIRKAVETGVFKNCKAHVPDCVYSDLQNSAIDAKTVYQSFLPLKISAMTAEELSEINGVTEGLENRILKALNRDFTQFATAVKTKRFTMARINRLLFDIAVNLTKQQYKAAKKEDTPINILAANKNDKAISYLSSFTQKPVNCPILTEIQSKTDRLYYTITQIVVKNSDINKLRKY